MPLPHFKLVLLTGLATAAGCASSAEWEAERASLQEAVREERQARQHDTAALQKQADHYKTTAEAATREFHRLERELRASRTTKREEAQALEASLTLLKQKEAELAQLRQQAEASPPTADEAVTLLKAKDQEIRHLRERLVQLQTAGSDEPRPDLEGIVTASGVDLEVPVARIDGRPVTRRAFVEFLYRDLGAPHLLDLFVNRELILLEGKRQGIELSDVDVEAWVSRKELEELQRAGSEERLAARLTELGFTRDAWRARLRYQARPMLVLQRLVALQRATPAGRDAFEARVREAYKELYTDRAAASHVFVALPADAPEIEERAAFAKAEAAYRELQRGVDFPTVAKRYSDDAASRQLGGQLGTFGRQRFAELPRLNTVLFTIEAGQVSRPVRSAAGYHVVRVDKRLPPERPFDAEVRRELIARLEQEPPAEAEVSVLLGQLRARARIDTSLTFE